MKLMFRLFVVFAILVPAVAGCADARRSGYYEQRDGGGD